MIAPILYGVLVALIAALFLLAPGLDLAATRLFYEPPFGFPLSTGWPIRFVEEAIPWITRLVVVIAIIGTVRLLISGRPLWRLDRKALIFIVAMTALGPGLIVNTVLKDHWGRARPSQVEEFGGVHHFTRAPLPAAECERNCAFVSGHAALAFSLIGFALLFPRGRKRALAISSALAFGAMVGFVRMAAGAHFLSDVVFAGLIVFAVTWLLHYWIVERDFFAGDFAKRVYRRLGARLEVAGMRQGSFAAKRVWLWCAAIISVEVTAIGWLDRPVANFFHEETEPLRPVLHVVERLGLGWPYLVVFGAGFIAMRWADKVQGLRRWADSMRRLAWVPAFLFAAVAIPGLVVDLLKVVFGRTRPGLLFADGIYDFTWLGLRADHWSFPSGHAATAAAIATAAWCLWPRPLLFYVAFAALVALTRIATGAHYVSDTVMGAFIGVLLTRYIAVWFARELFPSLYSRRGVVAPALPQA